MRTAIEIKMGQMIEILSRASLELSLSDYCELLEELGDETQARLQVLREEAEREMDTD